MEPLCIEGEKQTKNNHNTFEGASLDSCHVSLRCQEGDPFVDMRLNAGTCQNCRHLHLKVRVDGYPAAGKVLATSCHSMIQPGTSAKTVWSGSNH